MLKTQIALPFSFSFPELLSVTFPCMLRSHFHTETDTRGSFMDAKIIMYYNNTPIIAVARSSHPRLLHTWQAAAGSSGGMLHLKEGRVPTTAPLVCQIARFIVHFVLLCHYQSVNGPQAIVADVVLSYTECEAASSNQVHAIFAIRLQSFSRLMQYSQ